MQKHDTDAGAVVDDLGGRPTRHRRGNQARRKGTGLYDVKRHVVGFGGGSKVRSDIVDRNGNSSVETVGSGERFDHRGRQEPAAGAVTVLEVCHERREFAHRENFDLRGEGDQLGAKSSLQLLGEDGDGSRELPGHGRVGEGGAEPEEPEACRRDTVRAQAVEVRGSLAHQDVTQKVIVDDNGPHLRCRQIRIVDAGDEAEMILGRERSP